MSSRTREAVFAGGVAFLTTIVGISLHAVFHVYGGGSGFGTSPAPSPVGSSTSSSGSGSGFIHQLISTLENAFINGIHTLTSDLFSVIGSFITGIGQSLLGLVQAFISSIAVIPQDFGKLIGTLLSGPIRLLQHLFSFGVVLPGLGNVPFIAVVITGISIAGVGFEIIDFSGGSFAIPFLGSFGISSSISSIGTTLMIIGAAIGIWGVAPQYSKIIFGGAFALIIIVAAFAMKNLIQQHIGGIGG